MGHPDVRYFIVHATTIVDCIDQEKTEDIHWNAIDPMPSPGWSTWRSRKHAIPATAQLVRPKHLESLTLVRAALADELKRQGFTGLYFSDAEGYET